MKKIALTGLVIVAVLFSQAQNALAPTYYADSQMINVKKIYFNPYNISAIDVRKDSIGPASNGSVYITLKKPLKDFITLSKVIEYNLANLADKKLLFIINGQVIKDTTGTRIDPSFAVSIHAVGVDELPFQCEEPANTKIVLIDMGPRGLINFQQDKSQLRIHGAVATK